jgi:serine/threonine protein kinase
MLGNDDTGKPAEYTSVADFYSLGCFLYNLLAGRYACFAVSCITGVPVAVMACALLDFPRSPPSNETPLKDVIGDPHADVKDIVVGSCVLPNIAGSNARSVKAKKSVEVPLWESSKLPLSLSLAARDVLRLLLEPLPDRRLGNSPDDFEKLMVSARLLSCRILEPHILVNVWSVQGHAWFHGVDWDLLAQKKIVPPWIPGPHCLSIKSSLYSNMPLYEQITDPRFEDIDLTLSDQAAYADVEYCCENGVRREVIANITGRNHHTSTKL